MAITDKSKGRPGKTCIVTITITDKSKGRPGKTCVVTITITDKSKGRPEKTCVVTIKRRTWNEWKNYIISFTSYPNQPPHRQLPDSNQKQIFS